jgi:phosphatidate cytidylyltransferase
MTNLTKRICSGVVLISLLFCIAYVTVVYDENIASYSSLAIFAIILWEYSRFIKNKVIRLLFLSGFVLIWLLPITLGGVNAYGSFVFYMTIISCLVWVLISLWIFVFDKPHLHNLWIFLLGYLTLIPAFVSLLWIIGNYSGAFILMIIFSVSIADSSAYFVGKKYGKIKLLPNISPGKTREGLLAAIVITPLSLAIYAILMDYPIIGFLLFGLILTPIAFIGDVFFSLIKRSKNQKDSSHLIPGHGGLIDLLDGSIAVLPFFMLLAIYPIDLGFENLDNLINKYFLSYFM